MGKSASRKMSQDELEQKILSDLAARKPWDYIAKKYHVSTKTIQKIRDRKQGVGRSEGEVSALAFSMFQKGCKPTKVVIELKQPAKTVQALYEEWAEMNGGLLLRKSVKEGIFDSLEDSVGFKISNILDLKKALVILLVDHMWMSKYTRPCVVCGEDIEADPEDYWKWMGEKGYLANWMHPECGQEKAS